VAIYNVAQPPSTLAIFAFILEIEFPLQLDYLVDYSLLRLFIFVHWVGHRFAAPISEARILGVGRVSRNGCWAATLVVGTDKSRRLAC
jgi:hypothetical protein